MSELSSDNEKFRLDDEFFMKKYIYSYSKIKSMPNFVLGNEIETLTDFHANGSYETIAQNFQLLDDVDYAYMVRTTDLESNNFSDNIKHITEQAYNFLSKSKVYGGELLINKIGTPGKCYLMPTLNKPVSLGMNLFLLRLKESSLLSESFLYVFFNTEFGKNIILRKVNGTVPLTIDKAAIKSLYIPKFSKQFVEKIDLLVNQSFELETQSKAKYHQAETLLLQTLNLQDFNPTQTAVNIKSFSGSFEQTGRLDAEFYQGKYDELMNHLKQKYYATLADVVNIKKSIEPGSVAYDDNGVPFIRVSDYDKFQISTPDKYLSAQYYAENKSTLDKLKPKKDTILFSKDGTVGIAYQLNHDLNGITSGAILHLSVKDKRILPEYLTLLLNSLVVQMQAERDVGGSIIQHWRVEEINQVIIPIIDMPTQTQIAELITTSNQLREQSTALLAKAKLVVEMAIEQGEHNALTELEIGE
ncbi:hypothetical protein [Lonepinella sp. MS14437]|uniref:restriction endonuclease subunit S n=1 Tax=Lonepinella sp. MS14437 TaxID=3003620 RepID=UPI0036DA1CE2